MKIKTLRATVASGKDLAAKKTYDVSDKDGRYLISLGKAVEVKEKAKAKDDDNEPDGNDSKEPDDKGSGGKK